MKHLKIFETAALFEAARATLDLPNVSLIESTMGINYLPYIVPVEHDYSQDYFTLSILEDGEIRIEQQYDDSMGAEYEYRIYNNGEVSDGYGLKYSLDNGTTWNNFICYYSEEYNWNNNEATGEAYSEHSYAPVQVHTGDKMLFKALHVNWKIGDSVYPTVITSTCDFNVEGNAMSLIWGDEFVNKTNFLNNYDLPIPNVQDIDIRGNMAFAGLFYENTHVINACNLILPATTLGNSCYQEMFYGCTNLLTAPILPATVLVSSCYANMFNGCEALTAITCLGETGLDQEYYGPCENWVYNVAASGTFTKSSNATWTTGDSGIPSGWTTQNAE